MTVGTLFGSNHSDRILRPEVFFKEMQVPDVGHLHKATTVVRPQKKVRNYFKASPPFFDHVR
jgi:hypothetical protein